MSLSLLAAKLQAHATLLPSQRELLERVLFQIEFNGFQHIHLVGRAGAGKTTLSLVLAELLSDSMNLAYFAAQQGMTTAQCQKYLLQQWFGFGEFDANLMELLEQPQQQPLVWILDSQGSMPLGCLSLLRAHPVHIITTGPDTLPDADLNLAILPLTETEAEQLLPVKMLQTRSAAERLQAAAGNLHRLLEPEILPERSDNTPVAKLAQNYRTASLVLTVLGVVVILLFWWLSKPSEPQPLEADNQPLKAVVQEWNQAAAEHDAKHKQPEAGSKHQDAATADHVSKTELEALPTNDDFVFEDEESVSEIVSATYILPEEDIANSDQTATIGQTADVEAMHETVFASGSIATETNVWLHDEAALMAMNEEHYVLQLGVFASLNAALTIRQTYPDLAVLIYQRQQNRQLQWVVVLADYPTADQARALRTEIPERLRAETPFIKTMQQVWQEIHSTQPVEGSPSQ